MNVLAIVWCCAMIVACAMAAIASHLKHKRPYQ